MSDTRSIGPLVLFVAIFAAGWTASVVLVWQLGLLPEPARPWYRTLYWCVAVIVWLWWQRPQEPGNWLGLAPVTARVGAFTALAFAIVLGWNVLRVRAVGSTGQLAALPPAEYGWVVVAAAVEELVFRGIIQTRLVRYWRPVSAIGVTSVAFLGIHFPGWVLLPAMPDATTMTSVFLIGAACGWLRHWTGSLWPAIAAHVANNFGALL
ncbi:MULTISPECIES: type II CAAX endopeptidase family protein [Hyphomicrobiales]|uniref:CPBP family intramembrane glutamic endopeptidase n=1 Tax=Hyphomicrobiales TaxID=356 RepID=UPI00037D102F|nr:MULTISPECIES: type II CAAX endopeptidase family protein [Phyllobacteriaceae]MCX8570988.1 CPBP family intramembrane metalloprotease [Aminobacter sp. MET-1]